MKNKLLVVLIIGFGLCGCANLKEAAKGIAGISTNEIEKSSPGAIKKDFNLAYEICYDKALKVLKDIGAYVYARDRSKNLIAFYVSEQDTTCVGIFFREIDANNTQLEVASASTYAKELIAEKLFARMEKSDISKEDKNNSQ